MSMKGSGLWSKGAKCSRLGAPPSFKIPHGLGFRVYSRGYTVGT